jgi:CheY-like chemotaxis protein
MMTTNAAILRHDTAVVSEGLAAVDRYKRALARGRPFDAVILELMVPNEIGGREAIELLSALDPIVTATVASGYAQEPVMTNSKSTDSKASSRSRLRSKQALNLAMVRSTRTVH